MLKDMLKRIKDILERRRIYVVFMLALIAIAATLMLHFLRKDETALPKETEPLTDLPSQTVETPTPSTELPTQNETKPPADQSSQTVETPTPSTELPTRKTTKPPADQPSQTVLPPGPSIERPTRKTTKPPADQPTQTVETRIKGIAPTMEKKPRTNQPPPTVSERIKGIAPIIKKPSRTEKSTQTVETRTEKTIAPIIKKPSRTKKSSQTVETRIEKTIAPIIKKPSRTKKSTQTVETRITEPTPPRGMVLIPAGEFLMGSTYLTNKESRPVHTVYLDAFYIDTHEVTVGEYKQFLKAQGNQQLSSVAEKHAPTDKHPIVGVSWHDAMAYAQWAGKRLPTEAEWEKAARGPEQFEHYPWEGKEIGSSQANFKGTFGEMLSVGRFKPNGYGLYDISGNVLEWCLDPYFDDFYENSPRKNPFAGFQFKTRDETIADFKSVKGQRVLRGGAWKSEPLQVRVDSRHEADGTNRYIIVGFRCVKDVQ